jgi:hypothetical protein
MQAVPTRHPEDTDSFTDCQNSYVFASALQRRRTETRLFGGEMWIRIFGTGRFATPPDTWREFSRGKRKFSNRDNNQFFGRFLGKTITCQFGSAKPYFEFAAAGMPISNRLFSCFSIQADPHYLML